MLVLWVAPSSPYLLSQRIFISDTEYVSRHSEKLFIQMADHLVKDGYKDVGYEYVSIDVSS